MARGSEVTVEAVHALLADIDPGVPVASDLVAVPGEGAVTEGARVVAVRDGMGLVRGIVYLVTSMGGGFLGRSDGTCTLMRAYDGKEFKDKSGGVKWFPVDSLAVAGGGLEATPLHLAVLFGCPGSVIEALADRNPTACKALDKLGRTPLAIGARVRSLTLL